MDKPRKPHYARVIKIVLFVLALGAFVMVCTDIGQTKAAAFGPERCEDVSLASSNENGTVIAADSGDRLLFLNPDGQLVGVYGLDDEGAPVTEASAIHQAGNDVYVAGIKHAEDGENIKTEGVLKFNMKGDYLGTAWKKDYEKGDVHVSPSISSITTDDDGNLILVQFGQQKMQTVTLAGTVTQVAQGGANEQVLREAVYPHNSFPYGICYDPTSSRCAMTDIYGKLFVEQGDNNELVPVSTATN